MYVPTRPKLSMAVLTTLSPSSTESTNMIKNIIAQTVPNSISNSTYHN